MTMFRMAVFPELVFLPVMASMSRRSSLLYSCFCILLMPTMTRVSVLGGRPLATSDFILRIMNGRRMPCSWVIIVFFASASSISRLNHSSNCSDDEKISGRRKLRRAQSSCRLFCSGVPVMSNRNPVFSSLTALLRLEFSFLIRCASSMIRYFQGMRPRLVFSFSTASYEHTSASNLYLPVFSSGFKNSSRARILSSLVPPIRTALMDGLHLRNSLIQLPTTDFGTTTR
mmetsp:Transcript_35506/g.85675  ORF Transcript_35506/g.85675 Transcript_35506/m.85675 type:complete len:229 (+) Transcript_35506:1028-1714(+)